MGPPVTQGLDDESGNEEACNEEEDGEEEDTKEYDPYVIPPSVDAAPSGKKREKDQGPKGEAAAQQTDTPKEPAPDLPTVPKTSEENPSFSLACDSFFYYILHVAKTAD